VSATALSCQELVELVTDYFEDALPAPERARFDAHIAGCDGCTAYLEQMRTTIALTGRLRTDEVPAESVEPLLEAFRDWRRGRG
jgi:anti-sigma factor RsiW